MRPDDFDRAVRVLAEAARLHAVQRRRDADIAEAFEHDDATSIRQDADMLNRIAGSAAEIVAAWQRHPEPSR